MTGVQRGDRFHARQLRVAGEYRGKRFAGERRRIEADLRGDVGIGVQQARGLQRRRLHARGVGLAERGETVVVPELGQGLSGQGHSGQGHSGRRQIGQRHDGGSVRGGSAL